MFRKHIITPVKIGTRERFTNLKRLLESLCLRRTKGLLGLPEPVTDMQLLRLSSEETDMYQIFGEERRGLIDQAVSGHSMKKTSQLIIETILRTRLFCNNGPAALTTRNSKYVELPSDPLEALSYLQANGKATCARCDSDILSLDQDDEDCGILTSCQHLVCASCVAVSQEDAQDEASQLCTRCPQCGHNATYGTFAEHSPEIRSETYPSAITKLRVLSENICNQRKEDKWY